MCAIRYSRLFRICVFRIDSVNAIGHVFGDGTVTREGEHLWPGILLCRSLRRRLTELGIEGQALWIPSAENPAHKIAYAEQKRRCRGDWHCIQDYAPVYFARDHLNVFQDIASNVRYGVSCRSVSANVLALIDSMDAV